MPTQRRRYLRGASVPIHAHICGAGKEGGSSRRSTWRITAQSHELIYVTEHTPPTYAQLLLGSQSKHGDSAEMTSLVGYVSHMTRSIFFFDLCAAQLGEEKGESERDSATQVHTSITGRQSPTEDEGS